MAGPEILGWLTNLVNLCLLGDAMGTDPICTVGAYLLNFLSMACHDWVPQFVGGTLQGDAH